MKSLHFVIITTVVFILGACGSGGRSEKNLAKSEAPKQETRDEQGATQRESDAVEEGAAQTKKTSEAPTKDLTTRLNLDKTGRAFVVTGEVRAKVKEVKEVTRQVETLVAKYEGFIIYTNLRNQTQMASRVIDSETLEQIYTYTTLNDLTIRLPVAKTDSFLKDIEPLLLYLDSRVIQADDVSLSLLLYKLQDKAYNNFQKNAAKQDNTLQNNQSSLAVQNLANQNQVSNQRLQDQVDYSTLKLHLYQSERIFKEKVVHTEVIRDYRDGFGYRFAKAMRSGWIWFEDFVILIFSLWMFWIMAVGAFLLYRFYRAKRKS